MPLKPHCCVFYGAIKYPAMRSSFLHRLVFAESPGGIRHRPECMHDRDVVSDYQSAYG